MTRSDWKLFLRMLVVNLLVGTLAVTLLTWCSVSRPLDESETPAGATAGNR